MKHRRELNSIDKKLIYIVDGEKVNGKSLNNYKPEQIKSFDFIKSPYDIKEAGYDPKKVDGLIKITSKKVNTNNASESENSYDAFRSSLSNKESAIYIVDGKEVDKKKISEINHNQIASIFIIKSVEAIEEAGFDT